MSMVGAGIESSADFPQLDGSVSGTRYQVIVIKNKIDETYIMVVSIEGLATGVIVIEIP